METEVLKEQHYVEELVDIIRSGLPKEELIDRLSDYHDNDIADALTKLTPDERRELYPLIGVERVAEIFAYLDDAEPYLKELPIESAAKIVSEMDSDDAVDVLEEMDATTKHKIVGMLDKEASDDVRLLFSYDDDDQLHHDPQPSDDPPGDARTGRAGGRERQYLDDLCDR